jgi:hypothetical protein
MTSSTAARATLKRGPASSITCIFPCVIVAIALSCLAGSSPLALRPCMHGGQWGRGIVDGDGRSHHALILCRSLCRHRCSSRAGPCADASEPDRQGLREARLKATFKPGPDRRFNRPTSDLDGSSAPLHPPFRPSQAGPGVDRRRATPPFWTPCA